METYLIYIGKSALAAGAFYLVYLILFQNKKQFTFNRLYLPISLLLSFVIPLITFTSVEHIEAALAQAQTFNGFAYLPETSEISIETGIVLEWYHYLFGLYLLGCFGFLFHLLFGHFKALSIIRKSILEKLFGRNVNVSMLDIHPFSFFNKIVLSKNTLKNPNLEMIIRHEHIHVREKHTIDILISELLFLVQWFNPFAWLIKDAIKNNLEYKTDAQVIEKSDARAYQLAMVGLADKQGVAPFLTALNGSQLKNRIIMMKKKTENKHALLKQLLVLPLLAILVLGLSNKEVRTEIVQPEIKTGKVTSQKEAGEKSTIAVFSSEVDKQVDKQLNKYVKSLGSESAVEKYFNKSIGTLKAEMGKVITAETKLDNTESISFNEKKIQKEEHNTATTINMVPGQAKEDSVYYKVDQMPRFPGGEAALKKYIANMIKYPEIALENGIQGRVLVEFIINKKGRVEYPKIVGKVDPSLDKEALRVISTLPLWKPAKKDGKIVNASYTVPVDFKPTIEQLRKYNKTELEDKLLQRQAEKHVVNGKITDTKGDPIAGANILIKGKSIGTISNINGNYAIELPGKNESLVIVVEGFENIEIPVKEQNEIDVQFRSENTIKVKTSGTKTFTKQENCKYKISGQVTTEKGKSIPAVAILIKGKTIGTVTDGEGYYEIGDNEPIETLVFSMVGFEKRVVNPGNKEKLNVILKKGENIVVIGYPVKEKDASFLDISTDINLVGKGNATPLYIVDGKEENNLELKNIDPENIESVSVLKDASATELYGEKGKSGVVLITTKKGEIVNSAKSQVTKSKTSKSISESNPLIVINGKVSDSDINDISPSEIHSVSVLKDESALAKFGEKAVGGAILITTKDYKITSEIDLRKYIAEEIFYPLKARAAGKTGTYYFQVELNTDGTVAKVHSVNKDEAKKNKNNVDEVVVVGYQPGQIERLAANKTEDFDAKFLNEASRVLEKMPPIDISGFRKDGFVVKIEFKLQ